MLDSFEVLSTSGVVLWSKKYAPVNPKTVDALIREVFIEERNVATDDQNATQKPTFKRDGYTLKWTTAKDFGLIFVVSARCLPIVSGVNVGAGCVPVTGSPYVDRQAAGQRARSVYRAVQGPAQEAQHRGPQLSF